MRSVQSFLFMFDIRQRATRTALQQLRAVGLVLHHEDAHCIHSL